MKWKFKRPNPSAEAQLRGELEATLQLQQDEADRHAEIEEKYQATLSEVYLQTVSIVDKLDFWLGHESAQEAHENRADSQWFDRLETVSALLEKMLARNKITPVDLCQPPEGAVAVHDIVCIPNTKRKSIAKVIERGWLWRGEVFRKATVIMAVPTTPVDSD